MAAIASTLSTSAEVLALLESGSLLGGIFVVFAVRRLHGRVSWSKVQGWCFIIAGLGLAVMAVAEHRSGGHSAATSLLVVAATLPIGFALLMNASLITSILQRATPVAHRESMYTLLAVIPLVVGPIAQIAVGQLSDYTSIPVSLAAMSILTLGLSFLASHRHLRHHFHGLSTSLVVPHVNVMANHRTGQRGHRHHREWHSPHS